jgi:ABC-2 type transport system permease protein
VRPVLIRVAPDGLAAAESSATFAVRSRARAGVLVLDSATLAGRRARYAGRNAASLADVERLREVVRREVLGTRIERAGLPAERVAEITGPRLRLLTTSVTDAGARGSGAGGMIVAALVAVLLYMMILLYGQNVLRSVLEEKTTRVAEVVMASVKPDVLMAGKVLGVGAVGLVQQLVWVGGAFLISAEVAPLLRRAAGPGAAAGAARQAADAADATAAFALPTIGVGLVAGALAFFVLGYLLYATLFAAAGAAVSSEQEAQQASLPVMLPLIATALFIQTVLRNPESDAARLASWFPLSAPVIMPMRMALGSAGAVEVLATLAGLALACAGTLWLGARIYRVGMLSYGQRPTLVQVARWVRHAG